MNRSSLTSRFWFVLFGGLFLVLTTIRLSGDLATPEFITDRYNPERNKRVISVQLGDVDEVIHQPNSIQGNHSVLFTLSVAFDGKKFPGLDEVQIYGNSWVLSKNRCFEGDSTLHVYAHDQSAKQRQNPVRDSFDVWSYEFDPGRIQEQSVYLETLQFLPVSEEEVRSIVRKTHVHYRIDRVIDKEVPEDEVHKIRMFLEYLKNLD